MIEFKNIIIMGLRRVLVLVSLLGMALLSLIAPTLAASPCKGASEANSVPGIETCAAPKCTNQIVATNKLLPHRDPTKFYQCGPGLNYYVMPCGPGTCFSFNRQVCVHPYQWKNPCADEVIVTPPPTTTTEATTTTTPEDITTTNAPETEIEPDITTPENPTTTTEPDITTPETISTTSEPETTTQEVTTEIEPESTTPVEITTIEPETTTNIEITTSYPEETTSQTEETTTGKTSTNNPWIETTTQIITTEQSSETSESIETTTISPTTDYTTEIDSSTTSEEQKFQTDSTTRYPEIETSTSSEQWSTETSVATTKKPFTGKVCPGVDPLTVESGTMDCLAPTTCTDDLKGVKFPHDDPSYWYECFAGQAYKRPKCATGRCFSVQANECVDAADWINPCIG